MRPFQARGKCNPIGDGEGSLPALRRRKCNMGVLISGLQLCARGSRGSWVYSSPGDQGPHTGQQFRRSHVGEKGCSVAQRDTGHDCITLEYEVRVVCGLLMLFVDVAFPSLEPVCGVLAAVWAPLGVASMSVLSLSLALSATGTCLRRRVSLHSRQLMMPRCGICLSHV